MNVNGWSVACPLYVNGTGIFLTYCVHFICFVITISNKSTYYKILNTVVLLGTYLDSVKTGKSGKSGKGQQIHHTRENYFLTTTLPYAKTCFLAAACSASKWIEANMTTFLSPVKATKLKTER